MSMGFPRTLNIRPSVFSPTGTLIGAPVAIASIPLTRPSVEPMAIHLTVSSPRCCATSTTSSPPSFKGILMASLISGSLPPVNLMSRTALIICVIFPEQVSLPVFISAIFPPFLRRFLRNCVRAGNNFCQFLRNGTLTGPVV